MACEVNNKEIKSQRAELLVQSTYNKLSCTLLIMCFSYDLHHFRSLPLLQWNKGSSWIGLEKAPVATLVLEYVLLKWRQREREREGLRKRQRERERETERQREREKEKMESCEILTNLYLIKRYYMHVLHSKRANCLIDCFLIIVINFAQVSNLTTNWKSGLAFAALIHRFRPDLLYVYIHDTMLLF